MNIEQQYYMATEGSRDAERIISPTPPRPMQEAPSTISFKEPSKIEPILEQNYTTRPLRIEIDTNIDNTPPIVYGGGGGGGLPMEQEQGKQVAPKKYWLPLILIAVGVFVVYKGFKNK